MLNPEQKKAVNKFLIMLAADFFISAYLSGVFHSLVTRYGITYNPFKIIDCMIKHGFPFGLFIVFFFVFLLIGGYAFLYHLKEAQGMDKMGRLFKLAVKRKGYGSSHFEEPEEYKTNATIQSSHEAYGTILGQIDESGEKLINFRMDKANRLNQHIAIVGASGSGKTYTFSKPYIFQTVKRRESIILTDPDGGLYRDTAGYFKDNGYIVRRFDLSNLGKSDGWHCLRSISGDGSIEISDIELNAQMFANTVIKNVSTDMTQPIYKDGPMSLLKALILRVCLGPDFTEDMKHIGSVCELLQNPAGEDFLDMMFDASALPKEAMPCIGPYMTFKQSSPNLRGNIVTNLATSLQLLQNGLVSKVLSTHDIDLELPAKQPCAFYCIFPDSHDTFKFIVSLFFSTLFTTLISYADRQPNGRCDIPVNFLLDEFPSIGIIPDFDRKMATIRKRAMNVAMIFQDITQLQNNYEKSWSTLLSNCSTWLSLGTNDEFTASLFTTRVGETTIEVQTEQHAPMESIFTVFRPKSTGEGKRALLSVDEMFKMGENDSIIVFQGHNPIWAKKYPYTLHHEAHKLRAIPPSEIPHINDTAARKERRESEDAAIAEFLAEHPFDKIDRSYSDVYEPQVKLSLFESLGLALKGQAKKAVKKAQDKNRPPQSVLGMNSIPSSDVLSDDVVIELGEVEELVFLDSEGESQSTLCEDSHINQSVDSYLTPLAAPSDDVPVPEPATPMDNYSVRVPDLPPDLPHHIEAPQHSPSPQPRKPPPISPNRNSQGVRFNSKVVQEQARRNTPPATPPTKKA